VAARYGAPPTLKRLAVGAIGLNFVRSRAETRAGGGVEGQFDYIVVGAGSAEPCWQPVTARGKHRAADRGGRRDRNLWILWGGGADRYAKRFHDARHKLAYNSEPRRRQTAAGSSSRGAR